MVSRRRSRSRGRSSSAGPVWPDGYLNRPEPLGRAASSPTRSATNPSCGCTGPAIWARWLPGGDLEYLGRIDQQVKIRGHQIELGEIEAGPSRSTPTVREAVVLSRR